MNTIDKIRAYIERRKKSLRAGICNEEVFTRKQRKEMLVASEELDRLNRFLSTFKSEKPMNQEGLEEEYKDYVESDPVYSKLVNRNAGLSIAHHFAQWGAEHLADNKAVALKNGGELPIEFYDKLHEVDRAAFQNGKKAMKEQMMKEAVESEVENGIYLSGMECSRMGLKLGDKVKLIICKED